MFRNTDKEKAEEGAENIKGESLIDKTLIQVIMIDQDQQIEKDTKKGQDIKEKSQNLSQIIKRSLRLKDISKRKVPKNIVKMIKGKSKGN